jgi:hypothetical protein
MVANIDPNGDARLIQGLRFFKGSIGEYVWGVARGYGTGINLEFGQPLLHVRQPRADLAGDGQDKVSKRWRSRLVTAVGEYRLWLQSCHWTARSGNETITHAYSNALKADNILSSISGQKLVDVVVLDKKMVLKFDLDGELQISLAEEYEPDDDQFTMVTPEGSLSITLGNAESLSGD